MHAVVARVSDEDAGATGALLPGSTVREAHVPRVLEAAVVGASKGPADAALQHAAVVAQRGRDKQGALGHEARRRASTASKWTNAGVVGRQG